MKPLKRLPFCLIILVTGCVGLPFFAEQPTVPITPGPLPLTPLATPTADPTPTLTPNPYPWTDELFTLYGICFEAAQDAAGQTFVLRSAENHIRFYDLADNSELCPRPVERAPFDFAGGERVLAGLWSTGVGCTARHEVIDYTFTDDNTLDLTLRFITEGDCNYELVRPYWIGVDGVDDVQITVVNEGASDE